MQMIKDAVSAERLDEFRKVLEQEKADPTAEIQARAARRQEELAEGEERNRHERRKAAALARLDGQLRKALA